METSRELPIKGLRPSKTNPRKVFGEEALRDLTESIRKHGVLQPILVRPVNGYHEIVAGERRYRAAKAAGLEAIPAVSREMTDLEALELQVVENLQREDLHPLEEAEGYQVLHKKHGYTVEQLAEKLGKSKGYVYGRMKLAALPDGAKKAFRAGELSPSVARLVARIPVPKLAEQAAKEVLRQDATFREAQEIIHRRFMLELKGAPFSAGDAELVPSAGPCTTCPKRTGNDPELYGDIKNAHVCTDPECFGRKKDAAWKRTLAEASAKGVKVLSDREGEKLFYYGGSLSYGTPYVDLKDRCLDDPKSRTYQALLRKVEVPKVLARDRNGGIHELVDKKAAAKLLKAAGHKWSREEKASARSSSKSSEDQRREKAHRERLKVIAANTEDLIARAEQLKDIGAFLRFVVTRILDHGFSMAVERTWKRRGWGEKPKFWQGAPKGLAKRIDSLTPAQLQGLVVEIIALDHASSPWDTAGYSRAFMAACKLVGLDLKAAAAKLAKEKPAKKAGKKAARR